MATLTPSYLYYLPKAETLDKRGKLTFNLHWGPPIHAGGGYVVGVKSSLDHDPGEQLSATLDWVF